MSGSGCRVTRNRGFRLRLPLLKDKDYNPWGLGFRGIWGFPQIRGTILEGPRNGIIVYCGLYLGFPF